MSGRRDDAGQITLLLLGYSVIVMAVVLVAASATAVHLARHRLLSLADGAAVEAADALDLRRFYGEVGGAGAGPERAVSLSAESVRTQVAEYLAAAGDATGLGAVAMAEPTGTPDGSTAEVTLATTVRLPVLSGLGLAPDITIRVTARARSRQVA